MIARNVNAKNVVSAISGVALLCTLTLGASGCKKKPKPFPPAPQLISNANATPPTSTIPVVTPSSLPAPVDTMSPPDRTAFESTKTAVTAVDAMVKRGVTKNPDKPEDDATAKCSAIEDARPRLDALSASDPEVKQLVSDSKALCSLEVPIINADYALKQVTISPSQASHQLMCKYAQKDIDTARKFKASDRRVQNLDARLKASCH